MDIILVLSSAVLHFCLSAPIKKQAVGTFPGLCPHPVSSLSSLTSLVKPNIGCEAKHNRRKIFFSPLPSSSFSPTPLSILFWAFPPFSQLHVMETLSLLSLIFYCDF